MDSELRGRIKERLAALVKIRAETYETAQEYIVRAEKRLAALDAAITELRQLLAEEPTKDGG